MTTTSFLEQNPFQLSPQTHILGRALAERIDLFRLRTWRGDETPITMRVSECTIEGIQKILESATSTQHALIGAGIGHLVRTLPNELQRVEDEQSLRSDIEQLLTDLQRAYPDPTPFTTESTVIDRLRSALDRREQRGS